MADEERKRATAAAEALLKKLGKGAGLRCAVRQVGLTTGEEHAWVQISGRVNVIDRSGVWMVFAGEEGVQTLWPAEHYEYDNVTVIAPPPKSRPLPPQENEDDDEPSQRRRQRPKKAEPQPPEPPQSRAKRQRSPSTSDSSTSESDSEEPEIPPADRGVWARVVSGFKVPYEIPDDSRWMYLYASPNDEDLSPEQFKQHAMAFRLRMCASFRSVALAEECDMLLQNLSEIMQARFERKTKREWMAPLWLLARFVVLVLLASSMGGPKASSKFEELYKAAIRSKEGKIDFSTMVEEALAAERAAHLQKRNKAKPKDREERTTKKTKQQKKRIGA